MKLIILLLCVTSLVASQDLLGSLECIANDIINGELDSCKPPKLIPVNDCLKKYPMSECVAMSSYEACISCVEKDTQLKKDDQCAGEVYISVCSSVCVNQYPMPECAGMSSLTACLDCVTKEIKLNKITAICKNNIPASVCNQSVELDACHNRCKEPCYCSLTGTCRKPDSNAIGGSVPC